MASKKKQATSVKTQPARAASVNKRILLWATGVALMTFFTFSPATKNSFINQDDDIYVYANRHLKKPIPEATKYFFGQHYFSGNYIPVTMIVYALAYHASGAEPGVFHSLSVLLHVLNTLLVFWFIYLLSRRRILAAAITALLFGIHPMHVESVAWIAELKDVLYTAFFITGLIVYCKYLEQVHEKQKPKAFLWLLITFVLFTLSSLSKPAAVIFPLVLILLDLYTDRKKGIGRWLEKLPFFVVSAVLGIVAIKAQQADHLINNAYPFTQKIFFASYALLEYIVKLILPISLSNFYPYPTVTDGHLPVLFYAAPVLVVGMLYGVYRLWRTARTAAFGFLFFFINILLVLQLVSVGNAIIAERYTYIPYIGLFFIIATGLDHIVQKTDERFRLWKKIGQVALIAYAITCTFLAYSRCAVWENEETVAIDMLNKNPDDPFSLNNKGFILYSQRKYDEAAVLFRRAIQTDPDYVLGYLNLVNTYLSVNKYDDAAAAIDTALKHLPLDHSILNKKGYLLFVKNQYPEAIKYYQESILIRNDANTYLNLIQAYAAQHDYDNAIATASKALNLDHEDYVLLNARGYVYMLKGDYANAVKDLKAALEIKPGYETAQANLDNCYKALKQ